jgi:thymidylate kinase
LNAPGWAVKLGHSLLPKPDLVFLLDAPPETLQSRKQEVTFDETLRHRNAYLRLVELIPRGHIIDATQPLFEEVSGIRHAVLSYLIERTRRRRSGNTRVTG